MAVIFLSGGIKAEHFQFLPSTNAAWSFFVQNNPPLKNIHGTEGTVSLLNPSQAKFVQ